jgi:hypothetical protein
MSLKNQLINEYQSQPAEVQKDIRQLVSSRTNIGTRRIDLMIAGQEEMTASVIQELKYVINQLKYATS